jgi:glycerophosphoryl diester phosphodiesterase
VGLVVAAALRIALGILASAIIVLCVALLALFWFAESRVERYTAGSPPVQFYRQLDAELLHDYSRVLGVAHNSGNSLQTTREAVRIGADVIEIDVVMAGNKLYAGHDSPLPIVGRYLYRGPTLTETWEAAAGAPATKLDLKESSQRYLDRLVTFLEGHDDGRTVLVSSRSLESLRYLQVRSPHVVRLLSVPDAPTLDRVKLDPEVHAVIDGISLRHTLLDDGSALWLESLGIMVLAWTVNDAERLNELVRLGVDAITSDNLAILELLSNVRDPAFVSER